MRIRSDVFRVRAARKRRFMGSFVVSSQSDVDIQRPDRAHLKKGDCRESVLRIASVGDDNFMAQDFARLYAPPFKSPS